jgi:hypothetical protein
MVDRRGGKIAFRAARPFFRPPDGVFNRRRRKKERKKREDKMGRKGGREETREAAKSRGRERGSPRREREENGEIRRRIAGFDLADERKI